MKARDHINQWILNHQQTKEGHSPGLTRRTKTVQHGPNLKYFSGFGKKEDQIFHGINIIDYAPRFFIDQDK